MVSPLVSDACAGFFIFVFGTVDAGPMDLSAFESGRAFGFCAEAFAEMMITNKKKVDLNKVLYSHRNSHLNRKTNLQIYSWLLIDLGVGGHCFEYLVSYGTLWGVVPCVLRHFGSVYKYLAISGGHDVRRIPIFYFLSISFKIRVTRFFEINFVRPPASASAGLLFQVMRKN